MGAQNERNYALLSENAIRLAQRTNGPNAGLGDMPAGMTFMLEK
jgi:hypothetical protein